MEDSGSDGLQRARGWVSLMVLVVAFLLLPEQVISSVSEELWKLQQKGRREVFEVWRSFAENPVIRQLWTAVLWILRKLSRGRFSSPCLPPLALRARAGGQGEVLILWSGHHQPNWLHEETYVVSWKSGETESKWKEEPVTENLCRELRGAPGRWGTILDVPQNTETRIRLCATNHLGRSEWSREEVEVTTSKPSQMKIRIVTDCGAQCAQCTKPVPTGPNLYACLVRRSIFSPGCRHGPFCGRCQQRLSRKVLPCCVCRGLIESWCEKDEAEQAEKHGDETKEEAELPAEQ